MVANSCSSFDGKESNTGLFRNIISSLFAKANQIRAGMIYMRRSSMCALVCPRLNCSFFIIFQAVCDQPSRYIALEVFYPFMRNPERHLRIWEWKVVQRATRRMGERGLRQCRSENRLNAHSANALRRGGDLILPRPPIVHFVRKQQRCSIPGYLT